MQLLWVKVYESSLWVTNAKKLYLPLCRARDEWGCDDLGMDIVGNFFCLFRRVGEMSVRSHLTLQIRPTYETVDDCLLHWFFDCNSLFWTYAGCHQESDYFIGLLFQKVVSRRECRSYHIHAYVAEGPMTIQVYTCDFCVTWVPSGCLSKQSCRMHSLNRITLL